MDAPIEDVIAPIPFPSDMRDALVSRAGDKGRLLQSVTALEAGDFDRAHRLVPGAGPLFGLRRRRQAPPTIPKAPPAGAADHP